jgi:hypothetical protein
VWGYHFLFTSDRKARLKIKSRIDYYYAIGVVYRPSEAAPSPDIASWKHCRDSAIVRIELYDDLYHRNNLALTWPGTHGILLSSAMLIYCLWGLAEVRNSVSVAEVAKTIRLCSRLLALGGRLWPLAQGNGRIFEKLADATIQMHVDETGR